MSTPAEEQSALRHENCDQRSGKQPEVDRVAHRQQCEACHAVAEVVVSHNISDSERKPADHSG